MDTEQPCGEDLGVLVDEKLDTSWWYMLPAQKAYSTQPMQGSGLGDHHGPSQPNHSMTQCSGLQKPQAPRGTQLAQGGDGAVPPVPSAHSSSYLS